MQNLRGPNGRVPIIGVIFLSIFGFIGLAVIIFLWSQPSDGFGAPPLFFKIFGSLIALAFMTMGFGVPIAAFLRRGADGGQTSQNGSSEPSNPAGYKCPNCGAGIGDQEVSPSGDVKCGYCDKWWNIHRGGA